MARLRFADVQSRPTEFLDLTSLTRDEFQRLVAPFETAFHAHMAAWRLDGKPRTARQFAVDKNCPLPTPEDRLFFLLTYLKTYSLRWCTGACSGWARAKPINGSTPFYPCCWRPCAPAVMPRPARWLHWPSSSVAPQLTRRPSSVGWRRSPHPSLRPPPPFCHIPSDLVVDSCPHMVRAALPLISR